MIEQNQQIIKEHKLKYLHRAYISKSRLCVG